MKKYVCTICGYVYDEAQGIPSANIPPGTKWEDLPEDWLCPLCGAVQAVFKEETEEKPKVAAPIPTEEHELQELSFGQMSALCSNLAKGCEKQYLQEESELFMRLADYYKAKAGNSIDSDTEQLLEMIQNDLEKSYPNANATASVKPDRGALRALVWSEKVSRILNSLLNRYEKEKDGLLEHTNIFVCEICGFLYIGEVPPEICPVCKVPKKKIAKVERR